MHKLLLRQLKRYIGSVDSIPEEWKRFIEVVDYAYHQNDEDRDLLERSLELTSQELFERNQRLRHDIAEREKAQAALREAKKSAEEAQRAAESANQAKSDFLSHMSHELRTPLNGILGYTQLLKRDTSLTEQQSEAVDIIHQSGEHLLVMINDILDLSKIEARRMELYPTEFNLPNFVKSIAGIIRLRARQKGLTFHYDAQASLPRGVWADEKRLRQVLLNLLGNAVKFTDKGSVTFRVGLQIADSEDQKSKIKNQKSKISKIHFEVKDTGVGMTLEQLKMIFLPFEQVGDTERRSTGTGLGLAISQQLVRMMGGELHVKSTVGQGSTFGFDLELPEVSLPVTLKEVKTHVIGFKGRIRKVLIVDDKPENTVLLKNMLSPLGFETIETYNGQDALNKAIKQRPDLILMDLVMPGMDGFETIRQLRQIPALQNVPVIAVSANAFKQTRRESLEAGSNGFLTKPLDEGDLLDALASHLHLEWIYDETGTLRDTEILQEQQSIILPDQEYLTLLYDLVMIGDVSNLRKHLQEIDTLDTKFLPFTQKISQLVNEFELDKIQNFLEPYLQKE